MYSFEDSTFGDAIQLRAPKVIADRFFAALNASGGAPAVLRNALFELAEGIVGYLGVMGWCDCRKHGRLGPEVVRIVAQKKRGPSFGDRIALLRETSRDGRSSILSFGLLDQFDGASTDNMAVFVRDWELVKEASKATARDLATFVEANRRRKQPARAKLETFLNAVVEYRNACHHRQTGDLAVDNAAADVLNACLEAALAEFIQLPPVWRALTEYVWVKPAVGEQIVVAPESNGTRKLRLRVQEQRGRGRPVVIAADITDAAFSHDTGYLVRTTDPEPRPPYLVFAFDADYWPMATKEELAIVPALPPSAAAAVEPAPKPLAKYRAKYRSVMADGVITEAEQLALDHFADALELDAQTRAELERQVLADLQPVASVQEAIAEEASACLDEDPAPPPAEPPPAALSEQSDADSHEIALELPNWIRQGRFILELSQGEFGARCGVSAGLVSRWETGKGVPNDQQAAACAEVLLPALVWMFRLQFGRGQADVAAILGMTSRAVGVAEKRGGPYPADARDTALRELAPALLRASLWELGWDLNEACDEAGVEPAALSSWLEGAAVPLLPAVQSAVVAYQHRLIRDLVTPESGRVCTCDKAATVELVAGLRDRIAAGLAAVLGSQVLQEDCGSGAWLFRLPNWEQDGLTWGVCFSLEAKLGSRPLRDYQPVLGCGMRPTQELQGDRHATASARLATGLVQHWRLTHGDCGGLPANSASLLFSNAWWPRAIHARPLAAETTQEWTQRVVDRMVAFGRAAMPALNAFRG